MMTPRSRSADKLKSAVRLTCLALTLSAAASLLPAAEPPAIKRTIPPAGIEIPASEREALTGQLDALEADIRKLRSGKQGEKVADRLVDVEVYTRAVRMALDLGDFFNKREFAQARHQLEVARERLAALSA